jgi:hypothetical protein
MVCSLDGVNVLLNHAGKKKGRPLERPVKEKIPESSYKNVMCGSISHYNTIHDKGKKSHNGFVQNTSPVCRKITTQPLNVNLKKK